MALDILEGLVNILCPRYESVQYCNEFIRNHDILEPIGPILYFLLFPTVVILIFIFLLSKFVMAEHKGLRLLLSVTVYIFIIIGGFYPAFLLLSELWYLAVIILVGLYVFLFRPSRKNVPPGQMPGISAGGIWEDIKRRGKMEITGERKRIAKYVDRALTEAKSVQNSLKKDPEAWRAFDGVIQRCNEILMEYENKVKIGGVVVSGDIDKKAKELEKILKDIMKMEPKTKRSTYKATA